MRSAKTDNLLASHSSLVDSFLPGLSENPAFAFCSPTRYCELSAEETKRSCDVLRSGIAFVLAPYESLA
jgi:hypothetical protein